MRSIRRFSSLQEINLLPYAIFQLVLANGQSWSRTMLTKYQRSLRLSDLTRKAKEVTVERIRKEESLVNRRRKGRGLFVLKVMKNHCLEILMGLESRETNDAGKEERMRSSTVKKRGGMFHGLSIDLENLIMMERPLQKQRLLWLDLEGEKIEWRFRRWRCFVSETTPSEPKVEMENYLRYSLK